MKLASGFGANHTFASASLVAVRDLSRSLKFHKDLQVCAKTLLNWRIDSLREDGTLLSEDAKTFKKIRDSSRPRKEPRDLVSKALD